MRSRILSRRTALTLLELLVAVTLLGAIAGVATLAMRPPLRPEPAGRRQQIDNARSLALRLGQPVSVALPSSSGAWQATALPDGSVIADSSLDVDRLTGRPRRPERTRVAHVEH